MPKHKAQIDIDELRKAIELITVLNIHNLKEVEFVSKKGKVLQPTEKQIHAWVYTGLNNKDFVVNFLNENEWPSMRKCEE